MKKIFKIFFLFLIIVNCGCYCMERSNPGFSPLFDMTYPIEQDRKPEVFRVESLLTLSQIALAKKVLGNFEFKNGCFEKFVRETIYCNDDQLFVDYSRVKKIKKFIERIYSKIGKDNCNTELLNKKILFILEKQIVFSINCFVRKMFHRYLSEGLRGKLISKLKEHKHLLNDLLIEYIDINNLINDALNNEYDYLISRFPFPYEPEKMSYTPFIYAIGNDLKAANMILEMVDSETKQKMLKAITKDGKTCLGMLMEKCGSPVSMEAMKTIFSIADEETKQIMIKLKDKDGKNFLMSTIRRVIYAPEYLYLLKIIFENIDKSLKAELLTEKNNDDETILDILQEMIDLEAQKERVGSKESLERMNSLKALLSNPY